MLDFVPLDAGILGFGNRWYRLAFQAAELKEIGAERPIRVISAPYFLATKFEAFTSPSRLNSGDHLASRDFEDIVTVIDGRESIILEIAKSDDEVRGYLVSQFRDLLANTRFVEGLQAHLEVDEDGPPRTQRAIDRIQEIAKLAL